MADDVPEYRPTWQSSATWISTVVAALGALGGLPLVQSILTRITALEPNSAERIAVVCVGMLVVGWIVVTLIKAIAGRSMTVEAAYLQAKGAEASAPDEGFPKISLEPPKQ